MQIANRIYSADRTIKYYFATPNSKQLVEGCLLDLQKYGTIVCVSSQLGCTQSCEFCASGRTPFIRNLSEDEIVQQVELIIADNPIAFKDKFQVTFMGSGEPFLNFDAVNSAMDKLISEHPTLTHINISTILPALSESILKLQQYVNKLHIQYSLHFTNDKLRRAYFNYNLPSIYDSLEYLTRIATSINDKVAINYILFNGVNDSVNDAKELAALVYSYNIRLKISELCQINHSNLIPSKNIDRFISVINESGVEYEVFSSKGIDINAGCGQFYNDSII